MLTPEQVEKLKASPEWQAFIKYLEEAMFAMDSCSTIPDNQDHDKVSRGRKEAVLILKTVLEPFDIPVAESFDKRKEALKKLGFDD